MGIIVISNFVFVFRKEEKRCAIIKYYIYILSLQLNVLVSAIRTCKMSSLVYILTVNVAKSSQLQDMSCPSRTNLSPGSTGIGKI